MGKKQPRCYIDSNVVIDYVSFSFGFSIKDERTEEMDYVQKILNSAKGGSILLYSSDITKLECTHAGDKSKLTEEIKRKFRSILDSGEVIRSISVNSLIIENARDMQWNGFPLPGNIDKIHIASAIFSNCEELITFDGFRREYYRSKHLDDYACIEELSKSYKLSVVYPSESCVAQREYYYDMKEKVAKQKKKDSEMKKQKQLTFFDGLKHEEQTESA